ncbi:hypothetical protein ACT8ZV_14190 [Nocardioides sp. MAHUQ-72]|uniref:hypothetical protein n=1 Tax=unclassified Nocardioides TaxID=2615069 RepID=UPI003619C16E
MYPPPESSLSAATVQQLDDQFFTSDPYAYIRSRVLMLLDEARSPNTSVMSEFARLLGPSVAHYASSDERTRRQQVAVDAFALRHQVAESLVRLLHVILHHKQDACHWVELVDTPIKNLDVITQNRATLDAQADRGAAALRSALITRETPSGGASEAPTWESEGRSYGPRGGTDETLDRALDLHIAWINYAIRLLTQKAPDLDAAHNKFKHGMGLRPQDDVLTTMTLTPPNPEGNIPLSALTGDRAVNLFDGITTEFLARASRKHGLESTQIAMMPTPTLVEASALAHTLALLFHNLASRHFGDHEPHAGRAIAPHPGLLVDGPVPGTLRPLRPFALRFPLTLPLRPLSEGQAVMFWTNGHSNRMTFGPPTTGIVVDDTPDDNAVF